MSFIQCSSVEIHWRQVRYFESVLCIPKLTSPVDVSCSTVRLPAPNFIIPHLRKGKIDHKMLAWHIMISNRCIRYVLIFVSTDFELSQRADIVHIPHAFNLRAHRPLIVTVAVCVNLTVLVPLVVSVGSTAWLQVAVSVTIGWVMYNEEHCGRGLPSISKGLNEIVPPAPYVWTGITMSGSSCRQVRIPL